MKEDSRVIRDRPIFFDRPGILVYKDGTSTEVRTPGVFRVSGEVVDYKKFPTIGEIVGGTESPTITGEQPTMDFSDALKAMKAGKKVRRESWEPHNAKMYQSNLKFYVNTFKFGSLPIHKFDEKDILADDWMIVE